MAGISAPALIETSRLVNGKGELTSLRLRRQTCAGIHDIELTISIDWQDQPEPCCLIDQSGLSERLLTHAEQGVHRVVDDSGPFDQSLCVVVHSVIDYGNDDLWNGGMMTTVVHSTVRKALGLSHKPAFAPRSVNLESYPLFDSHCHIIDPRFRLQANQGFVPDAFTVDDYRERLSSYSLQGGAVVSGSFQGQDHTYLTAALARLGPGFVGVIDLDPQTTDEEILALHSRGVRAIRCNLFRNESTVLKNLPALAARVHELVGWHVELYVDSNDLPDLMPILTRLPKICIDHLGLSTSGFGHLLRLVEQGAWVKACGFGRGDLDVSRAIKTLHSANPEALMFGTDLPSTRAPRPYQDSDFDVVTDTLEPAAAQAVLSGNALKLYRPAAGPSL